MNQFQYHKKAFRYEITQIVFVNNINNFDFNVQHTMYMYLYTLHNWPGSLITQQKFAKQK